MLNVLQVLKEAETKAVENQEVRDMRICPNLKGGRQGDVYIIRVNNEKDLRKLEKIISSRGGAWKGFSFGREFEKRNTNQLADGSSKGSRHFAVGENLQILFCRKGAHPCAGGLIIAKSDWDNTHPEHAHFKYSAGQFAFFFQLDAKKEGEVRRVQD